jgi:glycosyltransferase involved in cell wall biosynthesis
MKPVLAVVNVYQFGYHTDTYNYCKYLKEEYNITYVSFHQGYEDLNIDGVKIVFINREKGLWNLLKGYWKLARIVKSLNPDIVFLFYARFISLIKLFGPDCPFIFDIRTGFIHENPFKRKFWNSILWLESLRFRYITIISEGLRKELKLPRRKCYWLPLGGEIHKSNDDFIRLDLVYLGTLDKRNIHETIEGIRLFKNKFPNCNIHYDIVGYGKEKAVERLRAAISDCQLTEDVAFIGRVRYDKIASYLRKSNIGIVYIPLTNYYDNQPATKLFEYLLAGMPVLATNTSENKLIVNNGNGVLVDDNPVAFSEGLEALLNMIDQFDQTKIRNSVQKYQWNNIVREHLKPLLSDILKRND